MHLLAKWAENKQNEGTNITDGKIAKQNSSTHDLVYSPSTFLLLLSLEMSILI